VFPLLSQLVEHAAGCASELAEAAPSASTNTARVAIALLDMLSDWDKGDYPGIVDMPQRVIAEWRKATAPVA
jgi:hypothetical protein